MPLLAGSFASHFAHLRVVQIYKKMLLDLQEGNTEGFLRPLADIHNTSCGLKAYITWYSIFCFAKWKVGS
jgi:hypothetical protein